MKKRIVRREIESDLTFAEGILGRIFASRGVREKADLDYSLKLLLPPNTLKDIDRAASILGDCVEQDSKILIVGQAPGIKVQESGIPWNDASGDRLRAWMKVSKEQFYNTKYFSIVPMGFCYPGKGKSGDLPPRPECAEKWMSPILDKLPKRQITLLIGQYAQAWFLQSRKKATLTETVKNWKLYLPHYFVLPHPSPRNNIWLKKNPWFEKQLVPKLKKKIEEFMF